jgi:ABC-type amino acid transport/signal transduction systems, periplasmic component/domain
VSSIRLLSVLALVLALAAFAVACGDDDDEASSGAEEATTAAAEGSEECTAENLETFKEGKLTVATDSPAYPPYFIDDDPANGRGFESAVAYAIAEKLGFEREDVEWTVVPFNASFAPGPKDFDFDVNQISITPKRAQQVDFSSPYYVANQAVVALKGSDVANVTSLADLKDVKFGVQIGTTSLDAVEEVIQPSQEPAVYDTSNDVVTALKQEQVDAVVVDVPTAFYLTAVQVPKGTIVGQFSAPGGDEWGALLEKDSPLTECVSWAIDELRESGELAEIEREWISEKANAPVLE